MRISTKTRYGVRFLLELASVEEPVNPSFRLTTQQIARRQGISEKYLESIAARLKKGGFVCASKGQNGGYWLAKPIANISVGDVIRVMETSAKNMSTEALPEKDGMQTLEEFWRTIEMHITRQVDGMYLDNIANN